jgi:hypothetical protein
MGFILALITISILIWLWMHSFQEKIDSQELHGELKRALSAQISTEWATGLETISLIRLLCHSVTDGYFVRHELLCKTSADGLRLQSSESFKKGKTSTRATYISEHQIKQVLRTHSQKQLFVEPSPQRRAVFQIIESSHITSDRY